MTFKINWEKSETQHQLPVDIVERMLKKAYPDKTLEYSNLIAGGCANLNIKIKFKDEQSPFILRIYLRDKTSSYREKNIGNFLRETIPAPHILYIGDMEGYRFAISEFMPGIPLRDLLLSKTHHNLEAIMYEVGELLTNIASHKFLKSGFFNENLEVIEELGKNGLKEFSLSCLKHKQIKKYLSADIISKVKALVSIVSTQEESINLVHADFDPANILVSEIDNKWKVTAILDWEFAYSGSWLNDVANILRYSHEMPASYRTSFLQGIEDNNFNFPDNWQIIVNQYNLASLLDAMTRHNLESRPNIRVDLCNLISHIVS